MFKITRELVEHYLRATGWRPLKGGPTTYRHGSDNYDIVMASDPIDAAIKYIALATRVERHVVAFRLGLCAAAESLFEEARNTDSMNDPPDATLGTLANEDEAQARRLLGLAGIDPAAWESARKR